MVGAVPARCSAHALFAQQELYLVRGWLCGGGAWTDETTFEVRICYLEGEVYPILRFRFTAGELSLTVDPNVTWDEPRMATTLTDYAVG
jgi:hypothetical protein